MWTSDTGAPYMVLTAHWINNEWNLKHVVIAFQRFPHPHTGQQIQEATLKIFQDFSIATKALTITIDNGANQVAAMRLLSDTLATELQVDFNVIRCGAHTIALVVNSGLKKFQQVIDKVRAFVVEVRRSPKKEEELLSLAQKLQVKYKKLIRDVKTRWNSTYSMLESFLANKVIITSAISLHGNGNFVNLNLTDDEWKEIGLFCSYLKPFFEFTEVMSGSNYPTLGTLLLLLDHLFDHIMTTIEKSNVPWIKEIAQAMKDKFDSIQENLYNSSAYLALILDPRFKTQILPNSISVETIKQTLIDEFNSYKNMDYFSDNEINDEGVGEKRKAPGIMDLMLQKKQKAGNLQRNEIDEYLVIPIEPSNIDPCEWWKNHKSQYPILAKIARDYICIPSTSVPSEQAFSKSGELISKKRNRLGDSAIEACMCLNSWIKLLNN
jgi:hAT family C-terminal dimerisation region/Domain of unknown function (DUF4413)